MDKKDFKVGQKVYLRIIEGSNEARYKKDKSNPDEWIKEMVVTKIGIKFITVAPDANAIYREEKFNMQDNFNHYSNTGGDYELFLSKEDIQEDIKTEELFKIIKHSFSHINNKRKYSLEQLKKIKDIIG